MTPSLIALNAMAKERKVATLLAIAALLALSTAVPEAEAAVEEIDVTPSNTNGIEIGELSLLQFVFFLFVLLKLVTLYSVGVLPIEVDLRGSSSGVTGRRRSFAREDVSYLLKERIKHCVWEMQVVRKFGSVFLFQ